MHGGFPGLLCAGDYVESTISHACMGLCFQQLHALRNTCKLYKISDMLTHRIFGIGLRVLSLLCECGVIKFVECG